MSIVLEILFGLLILFSFFVAYLSAKTWRAGHVVLVAFIFLISVGYFYLAARTLQTHKAWRSLANQQQADIQQVKSQNRLLLDGPEKGPGSSEAVAGIPGQQEFGIRDLAHQIEQLTVQRGAAWFKVAHQAKGNDGQAQVTIEAPQPHGLSLKDTVFVFEQTPLKDGGRYLGEFQVTAAPDKSKTVEIAPNLPLTPEQLERVKANAKEPWSVYALMPPDNPRFFASMDDKTRQSMLPPGSAEEFKSADRPPRDYLTFFHQNHVQRQILADAISKSKSDLERTTVAASKTEEEIKYRQAEAEKLKHDLEKFRYEQKVIAEYHQQVQQRVVEIRKTWQDVFAANQRLAAELIGIHYRAIQQIDQRSPAADLSSVGP